MVKKIIGGVGDFLQVVDAAQKEKEIKVYSHASCAEQFFRPLGVSAKIIHFENIEEISSAHDEEDLDRFLFSAFKLPEDSMALAEKNVQGEDFVVGIHPLGSQFWNTHMSSRNIAIEKAIPPAIVSRLIKMVNPGARIQLFGSPGQLTEYKKELGWCPNVSYIEYENIWDSLCHVMFCHLVIAMDSSIKTMAACQRIPSIVFVPDMIDPFRDQWFIDPYVSQGLMHTIKYSSIGEYELDKIKLLI